MTHITAGRRDAIRKLLEGHPDQKAFIITREDVLALLDLADERDRTVKDLMVADRRNEVLQKALVDMAGAES